MENHETLLIAPLISPFTNGWAPLFSRGSLGPLLVLTGGVAIHALSLRVSATMAFGRLALLAASILAVAIGGVSERPSTSGIWIAIGIVLLVAMLRIDAHSDTRAGGSRLLPSGAFIPRTTLGAVSLVMALMVASTTAAFYVPYVGTEIRGHAPVIGGYSSAIIAISWTIAAFASASAGRIWARRCIIAGPMLTALGLLLTGWTLTTAPLVLVAATLALVGAGVGLAWSHLGTLMMASAKETERDLAGAFISTNSLIAQAFASAFAGMAANLAGFADPVLGSAGAARAVFWLFLAFSLLPIAALAAAIPTIRLSAPIPNRHNTCGARADGPC